MNETFEKYKKRNAISINNWRQEILKRDERRYFNFSTENERASWLEGDCGAISQRCRENGLKKRRGARSISLRRIMPGINLMSSNYRGWRSLALTFVQ